MLNVVKLNQVNKWFDNKSRCEISSLLWANILLAHTRITFADGQTMDFAPALCDINKDAVWFSGVIGETQHKIDNPNLPEDERTITTQDNFDGTIFRIVSAEGTDNLRIRIRAYHRHDGAEFGHPGIMRLADTDLREWIAVHNMLDKKVKELWRINVRDKEVQ